MVWREILRERYVLSSEIVENQMLGWADSGNMWLVRTAIIFQLKYKEETDIEVLSRVIEKNSNTKNFLSIRRRLGAERILKTNKAW